ncbi:ATP-binding protein [Streptomyces sp. Ru73]|uniref:FxSxx-COOH system tetratricopeptide repeat protein n=1 Tax=Streptomyces sp. Ru73 TaxID=2080748 RepID=UPI000CDD9B3A|nr:FxSxx-COOH system tetratricopeptide repeat protein [Streptomyces sp. Ru73]POX41160.1 ATP-binding protein [Streptomyces sp. Ru73]
MAQPAESTFPQRPTGGTTRVPRPARPVRPGPPAGPRVTVSVAGDSRAWGDWIADRLERHGLRAPLHHWDPPAAMELRSALGGLTLSGGRILLVFSAGYFQPGVRTGREWDTALAAVTAAHPGRFTAVSVTDPGNLPAGAAALGPAQLTEAGALHAERLLLRRLGLPDTPAPGPGGPRFPLDAPAVWGGVPRRNPRFTGRAALLALIHRRLERSVRGAAVCTLLGMAGVGKTQLAAEYVHRFATEYDVVWWVNAGDGDRARRKMAALAPELGLRTRPEERLRAVVDALRRGEPHRRWLLVLDGADDPAAVADLLPSGSGHVLITSRNSSWDTYNTLLLPVPVFDRPESVAFVRRRAPRLTAEDAGRLAAALEDLPLLLDQTAGWLNDSDMSVTRYLRLLEGGIGNARTVVADDFPMTFAAAWTALLDRIAETAPDAAELLRLCAVLAPGTVPVDLLARVRGDFTPVTGDHRRLQDALRLLARYSVVEAAENAAGTEVESVHLHRMVRLLVREGIPATERERYAGAVRGALAAADPGSPDEPAHWPAYAALLPHLLPSGALDADPAETAGPVLHCLRYAYLTGAQDTGLALARRAEHGWRRLLAEDHPRRLDLLHEHTNLLRATGQYAACEALDRPALERLLGRRGTPDAEILRAAAGLAADLRGLARLQEALELSRYVLDGSRQTFGEHDPRTLAAQNNLAVSLRLLGAHDQARELDERTLLARRQVLGPGHPWTLYSELHHATDLRLTGRIDQALAVQERNVRGHQRVLGADHPQSLRAGHGLALCRRGAGQGERARQGMEALLDRSVRLLGRRDPLTLMIAAGFGCLERESGDPERAVAVAERTYAAYRDLLGAAHPYTVGSDANHALALLATGDRDAALGSLARAVPAMEVAVGPGHPWTLDLAHNARSADADLPPYQFRDFEPLTI